MHVYVHTYKYVDGQKHEKKNIVHNNGLVSWILIKKRVKTINQISNNTERIS